MIAEHNCIKCGTRTRWRYGVEPMPACRCEHPPEPIDSGIAVESDNFDAGKSGWRIDPYFGVPCP